MPLNRPLPVTPFPIGFFYFRVNLILYKYPECSLLQSHFIPPVYEDGTDRVFRNVGIYNSDAGELPKRKHYIDTISTCNLQVGQALEGTYLTSLR